MMLNSEFIGNSGLPNKSWSIQRFNMSVYVASHLSLLFGSISLFIFSLIWQSLSTFLAFVLFGLTSYLYIRRGGGLPSSLFLLVYGLSVFASVILFFIYTSRYGSPYIGGGSDDLAFDNFAEIVSKNLWYFDPEAIGSLIDYPWHNSKGYIYLVSLLVRFGNIFGDYNTMIPRLFNCCLLGLAAVLTRNIANQIGLNPRQALTTALWVGLFPMMVFVAIHTFRDILMAILLLLALKASLTISTRRDYYVPFISSLSFFPLAFLTIQLRYLYIIPLLAMLFTAWLSRLWPQEKLSSSGIFILMIVALIVSQIIFKADLSFVLSTYEYIEVYAEGLKDGTERGGVEEGLAVRLFSLPTLLQYFARFFYALLTPLPIYYPNIEWNLLGLGSIAQFFFATFVILGIKLTYRDIRLWPLLSGFIIIFLSYAMGSFVFRQITAWFPFAVILGVIGYERYRHHRKPIFAVCILAMGSAGFMYIFLKI
jgi:hypothetical protein